MLRTHCLRHCTKQTICGSHTPDSADIMAECSQDYPSLTSTVTQEDSNSATCNSVLHITKYLQDYMMQTTRVQTTLTNCHGFLYHLSLTNYPVHMQCDLIIFPEGGGGSYILWRKMANIAFMPKGKIFRQSCLRA